VAETEVELEGVKLNVGEELTLLEDVGLGVAEVVIEAL